MRILPFEIGDLAFLHVEGNRELEIATQAVWHRISDASQEKWNNASSKWCEDGSGSGYITVTFAVFKDGELWGAWGLYRLSAANEENTCFTCRMAPMLPDLLDGDMENPPDLSRVRSIIAWLLDNELATDTGEMFCVVRRRNPDDTEAVEFQHEWNNIENMEDSLTLYADDKTGDNSERTGVDGS